MRTYVITTGTAFALVTLAHVWRVFVERHLITDPPFLAITALSTTLAVWAGVLALRRSSR